MLQWRSSLPVAFFPFQLCFGGRVREKAFIHAAFTDACQQTCRHCLPAKFLSIRSCRAQAPKQKNTWKVLRHLTSLSSPKWEENVSTVSLFTNTVVHKWILGSEPIWTPLSTKTAAHLTTVSRFVTCGHYTHTHTYIYLQFAFNETLTWLLHNVMYIQVCVSVVGCDCGTITSLHECYCYLLNSVANRNIWEKNPKTAHSFIQFLLYQICHTITQTSMFKHY